MFVEIKREGEAPVIEEWQQVLLDAAIVLEVYGWIQGELWREDGVCVMGAINQTTQAQWAKQRALCALARSIGDAVSLATWNDERTRTKAECVAALREAARA